MKIKKAVVKKSTSKPQAQVQVSKSSAAKPVTVEMGLASLRNGINIGQTTGLRVMAFQDATLASNDQPKRPAPLAHIPGQLTDTELAKVWRDEFPNSRAVQNGRINEEIVRGVRNLYNRGTQGHGTPGQTHASQPWVLNGKLRTQATYVRTRKAPAASTKTPATPAVESAVVAKRSAKVVTGKAAQAVLSAKAKAKAKAKGQGVARRAKAA
jgi:hypothetical protein